MSTFTTSRTDASFHSGISAGSLLMRLVTVVENMLERRRSRLALMELTDDMLKDIGVSRSEAYQEASRPFWN